jgi:DNA repair protein RadC
MILQTTRQIACRYPEQLCPNMCVRCAEEHAHGEQLWFEWSGDIRGERLAGRTAAIQFIRERLANAPLEYLFALYLDDHLRLVDIICLGRGSINSVAVPFAEIVRRGFAVEAACFLLVHNHPSGDPTPSPTDVRITRRIGYVTQELDMPLVDHLIVASNGIGSVGQW